VRLPFADIEEGTYIIESIEEKESENGNEYVLLESGGRNKFYAWSDGWKKELLENKEDYLGEMMRVNFEAVDPPYYCVLRYIYPEAWDDQNPEELNFDKKRCFKMTDDNQLKASDVPREERIVNQASMKFAAKILDHKLEDEGGYEDDQITEELNKWMSKFKRAAITGEIE